MHQFNFLLMGVTKVKPFLIQALFLGGTGHFEKRTIDSTDNLLYWSELGVNVQTKRNDFAIYMMVCCYIKGKIV